MEKEKEKKRRAVNTSSSNKNFVNSEKGFSSALNRSEVIRKRKNHIFLKA